MEKSIEQQSSTVCTSVSSSMNIEEFLANRERHKLHCEADFIHWIMFFVGAARCAGHWETLNDAAVELVATPKGMMIWPGPILGAELFLEKWVSGEFLATLDNADNASAFPTKFLLIKSMFDPTGRITEAVEKLDDIDIDDSTPVCLIINKFLVFQYELVHAGAKFSDNQLLRLMLPALSDISEHVFDRYWEQVRDHDYSDILSVFKAFAVYEAHGKPLKVSSPETESADSGRLHGESAVTADTQDDQMSGSDETQFYFCGVAIGPWGENSA